MAFKEHMEVQRCGLYSTVSLYSDWQPFRRPGPMHSTYH